MDGIFVDGTCTACDGKGTVDGRICEICGGYGINSYYREDDSVPSVPSNEAIQLRKTREWRMVSMATLADEFGLSVVELSDVERGRKEIDDELRKKIAR